MASYFFKRKSMRKQETNSKRNDVIDVFYINSLKSKEKKHPDFFFIYIGILSVVGSLISVSCFEFAITKD